MTRPRPGRRTGMRRAAKPAKPSSAPARGARRRTKSKPWRAILVVGLIIAAPTTTWLLYDHVDTPAARPGLPRISETASGMLRVVWHPVARAERYEISVKPLTDGGRKSTVASPESDAQLANLAPDTKYQIRVRAAVPSGNATKMTAFSSPAIATTSADNRPRLLVPEDLRIAETSPPEVRVNWEPTSGSTGYDVQYAKSADFKKATQKHSTATALSLKLIDGNTEWHIRVRATGTGSTRSEWTTPLKIITSPPDQPRTLRVASYNVLCHSCDGASWGQRRSTVAKTIDSVRPDVVGLQEALQSRPRGFSVPQFVDLVKAVNGLGNDYAVTNAAIDASKGERIIYRPSTLTLLKTSQIKYSSQRRGATSRYAVWAKFRERATGKEFFFFTTHLEPGSSSVRLAQAKQLARNIPLIAGKLPAVAVGDFNASQYHYYAVHQALTGAGMVDPLGVQSHSRTPSADATVEKRIHTNYDTYNGSRSTPHVSTSNPEGNGIFLDYIFTTPMRVVEFEVVVRLDSAGRFIRPIPSDHTMLRADVVLPGGNGS